jgi:hypothetical protein
MDRQGSIVFLVPIGFTDDGVYAVSTTHGEAGNRRHIASCLMGRHTVASEFRTPRGSWIMTTTEIRAAGPRRAVGCAAPFSAEFADYLRARFLEGAS